MIILDSLLYAFHIVLIQHITWWRRLKNEKKCQIANYDLPIEKQPQQILVIEIDLL